MSQVRIREEAVAIPTYEVGAADKNPMFWSKEFIRAVRENEYLKIMILPQLGGRVQRAYDKTNVGKTRS